MLLYYNTLLLEHTTFCINLALFHDPVQALLTIDL